MKRLFLSQICLGFLSSLASAETELPEPVEALIWNLADHEAETGAKWRTVDFPTVPGVLYELQTSEDLVAWTSQETIYGLGHNLHLSLFELEEAPPAAPGAGQPFVFPPRVNVFMLARPARDGGIVLSWRSLEVGGPMLHRWVSGDLDPAWQRMPFYSRLFGSHYLFVGASIQSPVARPEVENQLSSTDSAAVSIFVDNLAAMNAEVAANLVNATAMPPPPPADPGAKRFYRLNRSAIDSDNDGIPDWYELRDVASDPFVADTDGDGASDGEEIDRFTSPTDASSGSSSSTGLSAKDRFTSATYALLPLPGNNPIGMCEGGQVVLNGGYTIWDRGTSAVRNHPIIDLTWNGHGLVQPVDVALSSRVVTVKEDGGGLLEEGTELEDLPENIVKSGIEDFYADEPDFVSVEIIDTNQIRRGTFIAADGSVLGQVEVEAEVEFEWRVDETETTTWTGSFYWFAPVVHWDEGGAAPRIPNCYKSLPLIDNWNRGLTIFDYSEKGGILGSVFGKGLRWTSGPESGQWHSATAAQSTFRLEEHSPIGTTKGNHSSAAESGIIRLGSGLRWTGFDAQELSAVSRHGVVAGMVGGTSGGALWKKFSSETWTMLDLSAACGQHVGGKILLSDDKVDRGSPERVLVSHGPEGQSALLVKLELIGAESASSAHELQNWSTVDAKPVPEVSVHIDHARVDSANGSDQLVLEISGTVRDPLSSFATSSGERVSELEISVSGEILKTIPVTQDVGTLFQFNDSVTIPNISSGAVTLRATTGPNGAGQRGWDQAAVTIAHKPASTPGGKDDLTFALTAIPNASNLDSLKVFFGDREPLAGDGTADEMVASTNTFSGSLEIDWEGSPRAFGCQIQVYPQGDFSNSTRDRLGVALNYVLPNGQINRIDGFWEETEPDSLRFRVSGLTAGDEVLAVTGIHPMAGSQKADAIPLSIRAYVPERWNGPGGLRLGIGESSWGLQTVESTGSEASYPVSPGSSSSPKYLLPGASDIPASLEIPGYEEGGGEVEIKMGFSEDLSVVNTLSVLPNEEDAAEPPGATAPQNNNPGWREPGDTVTWDDLMTAYKFIYGENDEAMFLLDAYLSRGNHISLEDVGGDLDVSYIMRTDEKILMKIEHDDDDIHPAACASLLYAGLHRSLAYPALNLHPEIVSDPAFLYQSRQAFAQVAAEMTVTAAELYLSGISIANEGLDWILVINDVSEGHYVSLAATLPFLSSGVIKASGGFLLIKNLGGDTLEAMDRQALEALVEKARTPDLDFKIIGELVEQHGMKDVVRKILTTNGGPVQAPWTRGPLETNMKRALGYGPPSNFRIHHDFIFCQKKWFAKRGINVNDAAFGRYVHKAEHKKWHSGTGFGRGGQFNKFGNDVIAQEQADGVILTRLQILQKLAQCRQQFLITVFPPTP